TQMTIAISEFLQNNILLAGVMLVVIVGAVWQMTRTKRGKRIIDQLKLKMPIFGPLFLKVAVARFTRTLGTLIRSGVNILNALDICAKTSGNVIVEEAVMKTRSSIQSGESIASP